jgi:hypothetical protein
VIYRRMIEKNKKERDDLGCGIYYECFFVERS